MEKWVVSFKSDDSLFDAVLYNDEGAAQEEIDAHVQSHTWTGVTRIFVGQPGDAGDINQFAKKCQAGKVAPHTTF